MQIKLTSVFVDDQEKALKFYTDVLGFQKKHDFPGVGNTGGSPWSPQKNRKACNWFWNLTRATTRPRRHINKRFFGTGYLRPISLLGTSKRSTRG